MPSRRRGADADEIPAARKPKRLNCPLPSNRPVPDGNRDVLVAGSTTTGICVRRAPVGLGLSPSNSMRPVMRTPP